MLSATSTVFVIQKVHSKAFLILKFVLNMGNLDLASYNSESKIYYSALHFPVVRF